MRGETCLPGQNPALVLQVDTDPVALPQDVASGRRTRFLWAGLSFAVLMAIGVAVRTRLPLAAHNSAAPSAPVLDFAFNPALPSLHPGIGHARTTALHPVVLPEMRKQQHWPVLRSGPEVALGQNQLTSMNAESSQPGSSSKSGGSQVIWRPSGRSKNDFHYFVPQDDPSFETQSANTGNYFTRQKFLGTRQEGIHDGSFRVQFTLPSEDTSPKAIELVPLSKGEPTFAAVKMRLSLGATINSFAPDHVLQVVDLTEGGHAEESGLMEGDIIRAVSMPDVKEQRDGLSQLWQQTAKSFQKTFGVPVPIGSIPVPDAEEGMVILDRGYFAEVYAALQENKRVSGNNAEVVLLVERPSAP